MNIEKKFIYGKNKSEQFKKEFLDEYITSAQLEVILFGELGKRKKNRMSRERYKINYDISQNEFPNRFKVAHNFYLWNKKNLFFWLNNPEEKIENKSDVFLNEFNEKYILVNEMSKLLKTSTNNTVGKIKFGHLPNAFQIPVSNKWVWNRKDIKPFIKIEKAEIRKRKTESP